MFQNGLLEGEQKGRVEGKQEGLREGEQKGRVEGKQEGRIEEKIETAKAMLAKGMEMTLISEITNLPEAQLLQLKEELALMER
ncbi:hypothetical protein F4X33_04355 [Candidatus Poribacteria bacterium]|nr:hypothetical protein [Candidatus Poribacteria bacterium]